MHTYMCVGMYIVLGVGGYNKEYSKISIAMLCEKYMQFFCKIKVTMVT